MEALLKFLEFVFAKVEVIWKGSTDVQVVRILDDCLNDPVFPKRTFEELLHQTALYDDKPDELRAILIRIGARRFRGKGETELWGYPNRNTAEKSVTAFQSKAERKNLYIAGFVFFCILLVVLTFVLFWKPTDWAELSDPTIVLGSNAPPFCEAAFRSLQTISAHLGGIGAEGDYLVAVSNNNFYTVTFSPKDAENLQSLLNSIRSLGEGTQDKTLSELTRAYPRETNGWTVISSVEDCE